jgi:ABC-type uncharacterized transport system substrate-binding protein
MTRPPPGADRRPGRGGRPVQVAGTLLVAALLAIPLAAPGQPASRPPRVGILRAGSPPEPPVEALRQALREQGYVDRQNVEFVERWAHGRERDLPALAADLVRLPVEVIVAGGTQALLVRQVTGTVPIVMPVSTDPVGAGLAASLARPGGDVTGLAFVDEELPGKWMEILKAVHPGVARHRLPAIYNQREFVVEAGGLMSYGPNLREMFRRAAGYVDRVLKGARPADLPIERPTRFDPIVNVRTARALGLALPATLLARADEVVQ